MPTRILPQRSRATQQQEDPENVSSLSARLYVWSLLMMKVRFGSFLFDNTTDLCALSKICDPRHSLGNRGHHARQLVQGLVRP